MYSKDSKSVKDKCPSCKDTCGDKRMPGREIRRKMQSVAMRGGRKMQSVAMRIGRKMQSVAMQGRKKMRGGRMQDERKMQGNAGWKENAGCYDAG